MLKITSQNAIAEMNRENIPVARCQDGETVVFETLDCSGGAVKRDGSKDSTPGRYIVNPATGPLYVEGAQPGDVLKVEIVSLKTASWGVHGHGKT